MVWRCFAASGPGCLATIEGTKILKVYQNILQEKVHDLKLKMLGNKTRQRPKAHK